jgi:tetratricopeptide (TPR) repeat protein/DNA-binding MarR family transcriptional regulator
MLALLSHHSRREEFIAPHGVTQDGIAEATGIARPNVSVVLKRLLARGLISSRLAHVEGERRTKKVYFLTPSGHEQARRLAQAKIEFVTWPPGLASRGTFVGRDRELKGLLQGAREQKRRPLFVRGLPGIGKTTLLLRAMERLRGSTHVFYLKFHEWTSVALVLKELGGFLSATGRTGLLSYVGSCVSRGAPVDPGLALSELGRDLHGQRSVLVFDDVQDASGPCASLLSGILETAERAGARVVAAGRQPVMPFDARSIATQRVREIALEGLGPAEVLELARRRSPERSIDAREAERLRRATGGNPLFLELLPEGGHAVSAGDLAGFIRREVEARLPEKSLELARRLSVFRAPTEGEAFARRGEGEHLADLLSRSLVARDAASGLYSMHEAIRESIYHGMGDEERRRLHARAAARFAGAVEPAGALEWVHHLWEAGDGGATAAALLDSGDALLKAGYGPALLPFIDGLGERNAVAGLLLLRGRCLREAGDAKSAAAAFVEARDATGDPLEKARASAHLANSLVLLDDHVGARGACAAGLKSLESCAPSRARDRVGLAIQRELGSVLFLRGDLEGAARAYEEALEAAEKAGERSESVFCHNNLAAAYSRLGRLADAVDQMRRAVATPGALEDAWLAPLLLDNTGVLEMDTGDYDSALASGGRALRTAEGAGNELRMISVLNNLGTLHSNRGEFPVAEAHFGRALRLAKKLGNEQWKGWVTVSLSRTCILMGQAGRALALLVQVAPLVAGAGDQRLRHVAARARAQAHAYLGEEKECREALRECSRTLKEAGGPRLGAEISLIEAVLLTRTGKARLAVESAQRGIGILSSEPGDPFDGARAREILAEALVAAGRREEAKRESARAGSLYRGIGANDAAERCARRAR